MKKFFF